MTPEQLKKTTLAEIAKVAHIFSKLYPDAEYPLFRVEIITKSHALGWAMWGRGTPRVHLIRMNITLAQEHPEEVPDTAVHEFAHLCIHEVTLARSLKQRGEWAAHGRRWKELMVAFGYAPNRCASNRYENKPLQTWVTKCNCDTLRGITSRQAGFMRKGYKYRCGKCNHYQVLLGRKSELKQAA